MSAQPPNQDLDATGADTPEGLRARLKAHEKELQALREENRHLRQQYAQRLISADLGRNAELPLLIEAQVHAMDG